MGEKIFARILVLFASMHAIYEEERERKEKQEKIRWGREDFHPAMVAKLIAKIIKSKCLVVSKSTRRKKKCLASSVDRGHAS